MKKLAKYLVDATLIPLIEYILLRVTSPPPAHSVDRESIRRAIADSADYADSRMSRALCFSKLQKLRDHAFAARVPGGLVVEFGVWRGRSISNFASLSKETIY